MLDRTGVLRDPHRLGMMTQAWNCSTEGKNRRIAASVRPWSTGQTSGLLRYQRRPYPQNKQKEPQEA